jgi:hypothetical protein
VPGQIEAHDGAPSNATRCGLEASAAQSSSESFRSLSSLGFYQIDVPELNAICEFLSSYSMVSLSSVQHLVMSKTTSHMNYMYPRSFPSGGNCKRKGWSEGQRRKMRKKLKRRKEEELAKVVILNLSSVSFAVAQSSLAQININGLIPFISGSQPLRKKEKCKFTTKT